MGKGTRNRQVRAEDRVTTPSMYARSKHDKQAKTAFWGTVALGIFVIALVLVLVFNALVGAGVFMRARTAAESDDFEINGAMMSYYIHSAYSSYVQYYEEMYSSFLSTNSSITVYSLMGIDPNTSLKKQQSSADKTKTWFQYFVDQAVTQVEEILLYCQAAKIDGVELSEEELAAIDSEIQLLGLYGQLYGYSLNSYLNSLYGQGVREKDVRRAMEYTQLATKYAQQIRDGYVDASTLEKVQAFYEKNKNDYLTADYIAYTFTVKKDTANKDTEKAEEEYTQAKAEISTAAGELEKLTTAEEFNKFIKDRWMSENKEKYTKDYYDKFFKEAEGETDDEKKANAEAKVQEKLEEDADAEVEALLKEDYAYQVSDELGKWVFGEGDTAAALINTTKKIVDDSKDKDKTSPAYSITVYFLVRAASRNEDTTRTFSYVMMTHSDKEGAKFDKTNAEALLKLFKEGDKQDKDALKALAESEAYKKNATFNTLEELKEGASGSDEIDEWLYSDERKAGDYELITYEDTSSSTKTTYYVLVLVDEIGPEEWYIDAREDMVDTEVEAWKEEKAKIYTIKINRKAIDKTKM